MKQIGVTETYDPCFIDNWDDNLLDANIIITKNLSDKMITKLIANKSCCIVHHTVTGLGSTIFEPNVPNYINSYKQFEKLIGAGFPIKQYVLRVDPIVPTLTINNHYNHVINVLNKWGTYLETNNSHMNCRISILDIYEHVVARYNEVNITPPYQTFHAPQSIFDEVSVILNRYKDVFIFQACAESQFKSTIVEKVSCVSLDDIKTLKLNVDDFSIKLKGNRFMCGCLSKTDILKVKPSRCPHRCLYCFWKK